MPRYFALLPAAGSGTRFGADKPKQYSRIEGKALLQHAIERLAAAVPLVRTYVAVSDDDAWFAAEVTARDGVVALRCGGATRAATVANALRCMADVTDDDWLLVHDAVRPCIDARSLARLLREVGDDDVGGILAVRADATLKRADVCARSFHTEPREGLWHAQTPQMFRVGVLRAALARPGAAHATDEAQAVEAIGKRPRLVIGSNTNIKVTYADDLVLATAIMRGQREVR